MALQVVHSSTDGFPAGVAVRPKVQFDVSGKYEEEGDDCRKGVSHKRKNGIGSSSPGPVRRAEPVGCVPERLHLFPREEGCRGRHGEPRVVVVVVVGVEADAWGSIRWFLGVGRRDPGWRQGTTKCALTEDTEIRSSVQPAL